MRQSISQRHIQLAPLVRPEAQPAHWRLAWQSGVAVIALLAMLPGAALARWFSEPLNAKLRGRPSVPHGEKQPELSFSASQASS